MFSRSKSRPFRAVALTVVGSGLVLQGENGSPGPLAQSCGVPSVPATATVGRGGPPTFPSGQYPVKLPAVSLLGARNDLPNPYRPGVSWSHLPEGRKWGSTASVSAGPEGTIWVVDRCGNFRSRRRHLWRSQRKCEPDLPIRHLREDAEDVWRGDVRQPHKLSVAKNGNVWLADNGGNQVFKLSQDVKILLTLGEKGVAGKGLDEFDAPTDVAIAPNGDVFVGDGHSGAAPPRVTHGS